MSGDQTPEPRRSSEQGRAVTTLTDTTFGAFTTGSFTVVDFYAEWCVLCHKLVTIFEQSADHHRDVRFGRLDVDTNSRTADKLGILTIPTVVVFDPHGTQIDRLVGATNAQQLDAFVFETTTAPI